MTLDRAKQIVADCMAHVWYRETLRTEPPPSLAEYSLQELIDANHLVAGDPGERDEAKGSTLVMMYCDDRLVAALYVLYHYPAGDPAEGQFEVIAASTGAGVVVVKLLQAAVERQQALCPDGQPCEGEKEWGHPCDRDEVGNYECERK